MKAYLAIKYKEDHSNKALIEDISAALSAVGMEVFVMARDFEKWGAAEKIETDALMAHTFKAIDQCNFVIVDSSEKGVGVGIEAGYAYAQRKSIITIAQRGSEISPTLGGISKRVFFYSTPADIAVFIKELFDEGKGVIFAIIRPDKTVLMQLRDGNSKRYKYMWCFPGGGCEPGEDPLDTVVREVKEEYDLIVKKEACTFLMRRPSGQMSVFMCTIDADQQPVLHEGADMKWMNKKELEDITIGFNQGDIVAELKKYL